MVGTISTGNRAKLTSNNKGGGEKLLPYTVHIYVLYFYIHYIYSI